MSIKSQKIEAQIPADRADRLIYAAALAGVSLSTFLVDAAAAAAERVIAESHHTLVSDENFRSLLGGLDAPTPPFAALQRAAKSVAVAQGLPVSEKKNDNVGH